MGKPDLFRLRLIISLPFLISATKLCAQLSFDLPINVIPTNFQTAQIPTDARQHSMGSLGVVGSGSSISTSFLSNPSLLATDAKYVETGINVTPWLRNSSPFYTLVGAYQAGQFSERSAVGLKFNAILINDANNNLPQIFERVVQGNYALKLTPNFRMGVAFRHYFKDYFGYKSQSIGGDLGLAYENKIYNTAKTVVDFQLGAAVLQIGQKSEDGPMRNSLFLPTNLQIGGMIGVKHRINNIEINNHFGYQMTKLLVPTPPLLIPSDRVSGYPEISSGLSLISGYSTDVSAVQGMYQSFYDAPGTIEMDQNGNPKIVPGSKLAEEISEIIHHFGNEFEFKPGSRFSLLFRQGLMHEARNKGNRKIVSLGLGARIFGVSIDVGRFIAASNPPLKKTMFVSLGYRYEFKG
ncbi:MAG: PorV/PorQ family protein [Salibacteraceae bacterium]